jgi:hypothetical protein
MEVTMAWSDPSRDVRIAREQALRIIASEKLHCAWTGKIISEGSMDIDPASLGRPGPAMTCRHTEP